MTPGCARGQGQWPALGTRRALLVQGLVPWGPWRAGSAAQAVASVRAGAPPFGPGCAESEVEGSGSAAGGTLGSMSGRELLDRPRLQCAPWAPEGCPDRRCCRKASKDSRGRSSLSPLCPSSSLSALLLGLAARLPPAALGAQGGAAGVIAAPQPARAGRAQHARRAGRALLPLHSTAALELCTCCWQRFCAAAG